MLRRWLFILPMILLAPVANVAGADTGPHGPRVLVSLLPIHSLVASIMQGVAEPELLLPGGASPHSFALRPSQVRSIEQADLVVWVGPELETFLQRGLSGLGNSKKILTLADLPALAWLPARSGGLLTVGGEAAAEADHEHGHRGNRDYHFWLSPERAIVLVSQLRWKLTELDPAHASRYQANSERLVQRLQALQKSLAAGLAGLRGSRYAVFHDAYRYFEEEFGIQPLAIVAVHPERPPGARRLQQIRQAIREQQIDCIFSEPQFEPRLVQTLIDGTTARNGILDPLGAGLQPGPEAYFELLQALGDDLRLCLEP